MERRRSFARVSGWVAVGAVVLAFAGIVPSVAGAQESVRDTSSLKFVPADTVFYASWLHNCERYEAVVKSRAFRKLAELPALKEIRDAWMQGMDVLKTLPEGTPDPREELAKWSAEPENKELIELLKEAISDEIFLLGDASFLEVSKNLMENSRQLQTITQSDPENLTEEQIAIVEKFLTDLTLPNMLFGFKVRDAQKADRQIKRLEAVLKKGIPLTNPRNGGENADDKVKPKILTIEKLKRVTINGGEFLQIPLDGSLVPWDEIPLDEATEPQKKLFERFVPLLKKKTLVFNLGVRQGYVLFSFGADSRQIESLGKGKLLYDHPQLASLRKFAARRITGIGFVSDEFMKAGGRPKEGDGPFAQYARQIGNTKEIPEKLRERLKDDLMKLDGEMASFLPQPGGSLSFSFLTPRGHESYAIDWSENRTWDPTKRLSLTEHVGGKPLYASVGRARSTLAEYQMLARLVAKSEDYITEFVLPELDAEQRTSVETFLKEGKPLLERFHNATVEMLYPALADGQRGFLMDGSFQIDPQMFGQPAAEKPLSVPLPAIVLGVSDAALLKKAFAEYASIIDDAAAVLHEQSPDTFPEFKLPRPMSSEEDGVESFSYFIPVVSGLLPDLKPTALLSKSVAAFSVSAKQTANCVAAKPPEFEGPAADLDRPLALVSNFDFAALIDLAAPWIDYAAARTKEQLPEDDGKAKDEDGEEKPITREKVDKFVAQSRVVMDVLKCIRGCSSVTYQEGKTMVRHTEWRYADLPE